MNPEYIDSQNRVYLSILNRPYALAVALCGLLLMSGCRQAQDQAPKPSNEVTHKKALIMTVNAPLMYMAKRLVDSSWAEVSFPADPSVVDPAFWNPSQEDIGRYQKADLILLNGGAYAKWILTASLKMSRMHDTSAAFKDQLIRLEDAVSHQHGPEGEHSHEGYATTTWLDFELAARHSDSIFDALKKRWPEHAESMKQNHTRLTGDFNELHRSMLEIGQQIGNINLLASHPVYQYAARAYGLNIHALYWEPDATPDESEWQALDRFLSDKPTEWMIWEETPNEEIQNMLHQRKIKWIVFRPQGGSPMMSDF